MSAEKKLKTGDEHYLSVLFRRAGQEDTGGKVLYDAVDFFSKRYGYRKVDFVCELIIAGFLSLGYVSRDFEKLVAECRESKLGDGGTKLTVQVDKVRGLL